MLRPMRRHVKGCGNYKKWDVECPPNTKLKCPLIIARYEMGPGGRKVRKEESLGTNDEAVAWQLINQMLVSGETKPAEPPKTVRQCIDGFLELEAKRKIGASTLKSFRKFLCGNAKRNPNGDYSPSLLEFAVMRNTPIAYLKDFTPELVSAFRGSWRVGWHALTIQSERLKQFFRFCHEANWIPTNPAAKLKPEVDPKGWTKFRRFLDGAAGRPGGGTKAAIHSGLESALGSRPRVALSSYQAPPLYGSRG